ncbi:hypothetical protein MED121_18555 [Marinomonas sp. MED121]|uniref:ankyrin repeat domain-containing protein n=1 Tax=Marinomonas sp. MED121 TaxID=314277 RepID=UPI0000690D78|nr:ankyrin repeat domain-containing protein [Marinomonas sp. MED121]EAQ65270.1 hypothetical protein MED121_18555 [Marinomonas sp. MED121]
MTKETIITPYYSFQHILREFAKGLGTKKLAGKKIDDACKKTEISPFHLDTLKKELIHEPLTKYVNIHFADHILKQFEFICECYLNLYKAIPLDGANADESKKILDKYFFTFAVVELCTESIDGMGLSAREIANSDKTLMTLVLEQFEKSSEWQEFYQKSSDSQKERIRAWTSQSAAELPEISSIAAFGEKSELGNSWGTYKARLITARLWDYFFDRSGYTDLNLVKQLLANECLEELAKCLIESLTKGAVRFEPTAELALRASNLLALRKVKSKHAKQQSLGLLNELKDKLSTIDTRKETTYYYHWMMARYQLHSGNLEDAIDEYTLAFEQVIYRQGENAERIIREALIAACRSPKPKKSFINRLRRMAVLMKIDFMPSGVDKNEFKAKPEEIESWEIAAYSAYFDSFFSKDSFFPDATYPSEPHKSSGPWIVVEDSYRLDLVKPDKMFSVGLIDGMSKKMPQLTYFSMMDEDDAVAQLLDAGANVNKLSSSNESAILLAVQSLQVNLLPLNSMKDQSFKLISEKTHNKSVLDTVTNKRKLSPLGCAVQTGRIDIVEKLIDMGATVDRRHDVGNETPLFTVIALISQHLKRPQNQAFNEWMKYSEIGLQTARAYSAGLLPHDLKQLGENISNQQQDEMLKQMQAHCTSLIKGNVCKYSTADNLREIAKLLISRGASPIAKHNTGMLGYTPLMLAIELNEAELVKFMLDSKKSEIDLRDTCVDSRNQQRIGMLRLMHFWQSRDVYNVFTKRFGKDFFNIMP